MGFLKRKRDLAEITVSNLKSEEKSRHTGELEREREASIYQLEEILADIAEESGKRRLARRKRRRTSKNI